jgi:hypothetical protein
MYRQKFPVVSEAFNFAVVLKDKRLTNNLILLLKIETLTCVNTISPFTLHEEGYF